MGQDQMEVPMSPTQLTPPQTTQTLRVEGMTCAACTGRVERMLAREEGVSGVRANLMTGMVAVDGPAEPAKLAERLTALGFTAAEDVTRLAITGMTCASCVGRVERMLQALPGVTQASVNLADETALVRHYALAGLPERMIEAVRAAGYEARIATETSREDLAAHKEEAIHRLARAVLLAAVLTLPVFVAEMGGHLYPPFHHWLHGLVGQQALWLGQFVLTTLVLFGPGWRFFRAGVPALLHGAPDMNSLGVMGASAAWGYSTIATFAPSLLPEASRAVYFEAAAVIVTLILLGRYLEARAKGRTGAAIAKLVGLQPRTARVERDGVTEDRPIAEIRPGDLLHLRPGERVAVDGTVVAGHSWLDESMLTGEPVPVEKTEGAALTAGTVNGQAALSYRAERVGADTMLARIIRMVEEAQGAKLPIQAAVDRVTRVFVPVVMGIAALTFAAWMIWGPGLGEAVVAAVAVLIIACPCAMGLATPTSIMVGTGRGAELGVLFRRGDALQALHEVDLVAFDKTGTLTEGRPDLVAIHTAPGVDEAEALALAAAAESGSEHPIAGAILRAADARGLSVSPASGVAAIPGFGLQAQVGDRALLLGAARLMAREGIETGDLATLAETQAGQGQTPLFLAADGGLLALLLVADRVKPTTRPAIDALHAMGIGTAMITGDAAPTAKAIAGALGIDRVEAEILPDGKVAALEALRQGGAKVAFVGDGINDAPALAAADVGLAIGTGTDVAVEAAEVVLMSGDLRGVVNALHLSRAVMRNIRQNLFWAFAYNTALIPVAAGALYPAFGLTLSPMLGAGAMVLSSLFVLTNALRLKALHPRMEANL